MTLADLDLAAARSRAAARIRPARPADAEECGRIIHDAFESIAASHRFPKDFPDRATAVRLAAAFIEDPAVFGVVAEAEGRIVGSNFLVERDPVRGVGPITVDPAWQNDGVGRRLMVAVIDRAGAHAPVRLVQAGYHMRSLALYASLGFEVKAPLAQMEGQPSGALPRGVTVRPLAEADVPAAAALCTAVHGIARAGELRDAIRHFAPMLVERDGRVTGYLTAPGFWIANHGVAETEEDMKALLAGAATLSARPLSLLLPTRQAGLFRWCLESGMRIVQPMTLMARGDYQEPAGAWFPSVFY